MQSEVDGLLGIAQQIVTGQSSLPVICLIQDAVGVPFWLSTLQPQTMCPHVLGRRKVQQLAADLPLPGAFGDLLERWSSIQSKWNTFRAHQASHPMVCAMAAAGVDYMATGYALLSLCLPSNCFFETRPETGLFLNTGCAAVGAG